MKSSDAYRSRLGKAVFPDFLYPPTTDWWIDEVKKFHQIVKFDGIWIDMK